MMNFSTKSRAPADSASGDGVIELRLQSVKQLFNSMDPSPFPEKDLDADAEEFIVSWAMEHPRDVPLKLVVHLRELESDTDPEHLIEEAMHVYFSHRRDLMKRRLHQLMSRGRQSLFIGLVFLAVCVGAADGLGQLWSNPFSEVARESLIIGGWVAMWRPMEIFLYDWWPLKNEGEIYDRLSRVDVRVSLRP